MAARLTILGDLCLHAGASGNAVSELPRSDRRLIHLGIGTSILLMVAGAILRWAVTANVSGVDLDVVGLILLIAGAVGLFLSLLWMTIWADRRRPEAAADGGVVRQREVVDRDVY
jgi:uncharacterized membrane protein YedE/YeeE